MKVKKYLMRNFIIIFMILNLAIGLMPASEVKATTIVEENICEQVFIGNTELYKIDADIRDVMLLNRNIIYIIMVIVILISMIFIVIRLHKKEKEEDKNPEDNIILYANMLQNDETIRSREMILSKLSHDMKNPMNSIMGMSELALENAHNPDVVLGYLEDIISSGKYLLSLINDILDIAKIESGKMSLQKEVFLLDELIKEVNTIVLPLAKNKSIKYKFIDGGINGIGVVGDKYRLQQIIINLLSNAVKFTENGGNVTIYVGAKVLKNKKVSIFIEIKDSGIGVAKEGILRLFEPFYQENRYSERKEGSGLGLTIVKELVDLMGGHIRFKSEVGKGTVVTLNFIFDKGKYTQTINLKDKEYYEIFKEKHVLVADDSHLNLDILERFLAKYDMTVCKTTGGRECYETYAKSSETYFDFVIIDINMMDMNGDKVAKLIRESGRTDAENIILIGLTAEEYDDDTKKTIFADMDGHLIKPINSKVLFRYLYNFIK